LEASSRTASQKIRLLIWNLEVDCRFYKSHLLAISSFLISGVVIAQSVQRRETGWTAGVRISAGASFFSLHNVQTGREAHPASFPMSTGDLSPGIKRPGREAGHSPPSSAEVTNGGAIPALLRMSSCSALLIKNRNNFTFFLNSNITLRSACRLTKRSFTFSCSDRFLYAFLSPPCVLHAQPAPFSLI
jgi:hypothetical protein